MKWSLCVAICLWSVGAWAGTGTGAGSTPCQIAYVVVPGDTLYDIARSTGHSVDQLMVKNQLRSDRLRVNQELTLPSCEKKKRRAKKPSGKLFNLRHVVRRGETISGIAKSYGMSMDALRKSNTLKRDFIRVGMKLNVRAWMGTSRSHVYHYTIRPGDTLSRIAKRFDIDWRDIRRMNGDRRHERLKIGDKIKLLIEGNPSRSEALGRPMSGRLKNGEQLKSGPGYHRRRPQRSWGTNETITHLLSAVAAVRARYPRVHDVAIGDISAKRGGKLHPHISHQSGRDVDIGYYFRKQKREGPKAFISALHADIDYPATWKLITSLVGRRKRSTPIQYIFMNYSVQRLIYKWARRKGISKRKLDWMFQYPHGRRAMHGIIRHSKGHHAHMHVRFRCPASDSGCKG